MNEKYKLILVDDEDDVRGRIISKIKPESGFTVVGKAGNGFDALELIEKYKPHVVLTDIKMPFIDGIQLARIIRRDYPTTKVAFISGYDEFDYAREAIELNVVSYLMKPVSSEDLDQFFVKLKKLLDDEIDFLSNTENLRKEYNNSLPLLVDTYLSSYRFKSELLVEDLEKLETYGIKLDEGNYITCFIGIDKNKDASFEDVEKAKIFMKNLISKTFSKYDFKHSFLVSDGIILIVRDDRENISREIDLELFEILKYAEEYGNINLHIGVSKVYNNFLSFPSSFRQADESLKNSKYFNMGRIIFYREIETKKNIHITIDEIKLSTFEYSLKFEPIEEVEKQLRGLIDYTSENSDSYIVDQQLLVINLANILINYSQSININLKDMYEETILEKMLSYSNSNELFDYVLKVISDLKKLVTKTHVNRTEKIIQNASIYIEKNYVDSGLSLESVSEQMYISVSYLSMLFKKIKGTTFNKFLIKVRMEKAKELLKYTDEKVITIASMCGYNEVYYFSHSFKKYSGKSPIEFRKHE